MGWSDRITHPDRGDLIQIAAPDVLSKRLKRSK
jgi:hypothetical protein